MYVYIYIYIYTYNIYIYIYILAWVESFDIGVCKMIYQIITPLQTFFGEFPTISSACSNVYFWR